MTRPDEAIERLLDRLREELLFLEQLVSMSAGDLDQDKLRRAAVERALEVALQCLLDAGNHIISSKGWKPPGGYVDIVRVLGQHGVLPQGFAKDAEDMARLRNVLVHGYQHVDAARLADHLHHLDDLRAFGRYLLDYSQSEAP
ncbi:MAG: type VII toxin-antitoxin system HepT family RNase toxin [Anaerolineae bacterium]